MQTTESGSSASKEFVLRRARPEDAILMAATDRQMWGEWANPVTLYRQLIDLFPETVLVAYTPDGSYAGCTVGLIRAHPHTGWVLSVDIAENMGGRGLGRLFLGALLDTFKRQGLSRVQAVIDPANTASQRLFTSFGFACTERVRDYFGPGKDQDRWELEISAPP